MDEFRLVPQLQEDPSEQERARWIGIYVGVLAVLLALCSMLGSNATKDATRANIEVTDTYAYVQAKNTRQMLLRNHAEGLELMLAATPAMPADVRARVEDRIREHRMWADRYETDGKEGKQELLAKAQALETERDINLRKDPYYDWAQALIQIAIVLASVALVTGGRRVLLASISVGALGAIMLVNGWLMFVRLPWIG